MPTSTPSRPDAERTPRPIADIARELGLDAAEWIPYGHDKAKVRVTALAARRDRPDGKLLVVSSITRAKPSGASARVRSSRCGSRRSGPPWA